MRSNVPRQPGATFDERRNTSRVFPVAAGLSADARATCERWAKANPAHMRWLADGHPTLTDAEHVARFGEPYKRAASGRVTRR